MRSKKLVTFTHGLLTVAQVGAALLFIRLELPLLALIAALAGKWRIFSWHPYRLWRNLKANSCDAIVIASSVLAMDFYRNRVWVVAFFGLFLVVWLLFIKPASSRPAVAFQAACCHLLGLSVLWLNGVEQGLNGAIAVILAAMVGYGGARHLTQTLGIDEPAHRDMIALTWAILISQLAWLSWLWSVIYHLPGGILLPQIALLGSVLGYFAAYHIYQLPQHKRRLPTRLITQQVFFCLVVVLAIIALTPWTN
jgi:hypothetical protein